jgi:ATP-dependent Clp protease ATP-binding subunit ClpB
VLFDEIEKAHHDVFNVLLQVLDDGRLTDGQGRTVDFKNTVVIMTSNIGSPLILDYFAKSEGRGGKADAARELETLVTAELRRELEGQVMAELKRHFRPEFLNRVDDVIIFHSLNEDQLAVIVDIQIERLQQRLEQQDLSLELSRSAKQLLVKEGYDPQFGARPLKRTIQEKLLDPLAMKLLNGEFKPGDRIQVSANHGGFSFEKQ